MAKDDLNPPDGSLIQPAFYMPQLDGVSAAGQAVIQANVDIINRFVSAQRTQVKLGNLSQLRQTLKTPDLDIEYHHSFGQERIRLTPRITPPTDQPYAPPPTDPGEPPTFEEPDIPDVPYPTLCMLVLYKKNVFAAIPMEGLSPTALAPIYTNQDTTSNFAQPVHTGQLQFNSLGFIQTDVDLSGHGYATDGNGNTCSVLCSTNIYDALALGGQHVPIMNGTGTVSGSPSGGVTIYLSDATYRWEMGKFQKQAANTNSEQPYAIDGQGTMYFGADFDAPNISLIMDKTSIDDTIMNNALSQYEDSISTWVRAYSVDYIRYIEMYGSQEYQGNTKNVTLYSADGQPYVLHVFGNTQTSIGRATENVYEVSTVVPNFGNPTGEHAYENNITEILGSAYYATSTYGTAMTMTDANIAMSHDNVYYYTFDFSTNYYQNDTVPNDSPSFSSPMPRMIFDPTAFEVSVVQDAVVASALNSYTVKTLVTQNFPSWGGNFWSGLTPLANQSIDYPYSFGGGLEYSFYAQEQLVVSGSTEAPDDPPTGYQSGYYMLDYGQALGYVEQVLAQLASPAIVNNQPLPNTEPGPSGLFSSSSSTTTTSSHQEVYSHGYDQAPDNVDSSDTTSTGGPIGRNPPGYKGQTIDQVYNGSITWLGQTLEGYASSTVQDSFEGGAILCTPFPYGTKNGAYYVLETQFGGAANPTYSVYTPNGQLNQFQGLQDQPTIDGWMHVSNADHYLQGIVVSAGSSPTPLIYLDGTDITRALATALNCEPSDIAACYFDISLDTIKLLGSVK